MLFIVRPILVAAVLAVIGTAAPAQTRPDGPEPPEVRTAARLHRNVQPDLATVTLEFTGDGATPAQAGSRVASRADSLRRALATLGIPRNSLVNRSRWYWWRGRIEVIAGPVKFAPRSTPGADPRFNYPAQDTTYRAHDAIEVRIHDVSRVGAVLDTALGRGITDISERSEEHTSELQSPCNLVCRLLLEKKKTTHTNTLMCTGHVMPTPEAEHLTRSHHPHKPSPPATQRYSYSTSSPTTTYTTLATRGPS